MKRALLLVLTVFCLVLPRPALAGEATDALKSSVDAILAVLKDSRYKDSSKYDEQRDKLKKLVDDIFDFREVSMRAVGPNWKKFTPEQQTAFVDAFSQLLESTYLGKIRGHSYERVVYNEEKRNAQGAVEIPTKIITSTTEISLTYRMLNKNPWRIYDVLIEGVSLVQNYRTQFQELMMHGAPDALIAKVKEKALELKKSQKGS